jgi:predicted TIM-barrel fold metal-dependent hydrolase
MRHAALLAAVAAVAACRADAGEPDAGLPDTAADAAVAGDRERASDGPRAADVRPLQRDSKPCSPQVLPGAIDSCGLAHRPWDPAHLSSKQPSAIAPVTVRLEAAAGDVKKVTLRAWTGVARELAMSLEGSAGGVDTWRAVLPASARPVYYRFRLEDGAATLHLAAGGTSAAAPSGADDFWIAPVASSKTLHYRTDFAQPELRWRGAPTASYATVKMTAEAPGLAGATAIGAAGQELFFFVRDAASGKEDHPPGSGDYRIAPDLLEAWLEAGTLYDVDPVALALDLVDSHTHPYAAGFVYDPKPMIALLPQQGIGVALTMVSGSPPAQASALKAVHAANRWILPLAWVDPKAHSVASVEDLLKNQGFKGLKLHPVVHGFAADDAALDPFLALAASYRVPVQIHSATDDVARPWRIVALAKRHPAVPIVMIHTELGVLDKSATLGLVKDVPNLHAETSWTNPQSILQAMAVLDSSRILFGTDSTVDGYQQFTKQSIANPQGQYVYTIPQVIAEVKAKASPAAYANWARLTAIRLYGIRFRPDADLVDTDGDGKPDQGDPDADNDGKPNASDPAPLDPGK